MFRRPKIGLIGRLDHARYTPPYEEASVRVRKLLLILCLIFLVIPTFARQY